MKSIAARTYFALALACLLLFGLLTFLVRYVMFADRWVTYSGSPHLYTAAGTLDTGTVKDRNGKLLMSSADGKKYADDSLTRSATMHLLGDREGNIPGLIVRNYAQSLVGYSKLNGTASMENGGGELTLTVSASAQCVALQSLKGRKGTVGVYNYKTGEILCAVTSPTFDPDDVPDIAGDKTGKYDGAYVYRFFNTVYTPGSIFKLVTAAAALEEFPELTERSFTCTGELILNGEKVTCPKAHGKLSFRDALAHSCNCTFAQLANELGAKKLQKAADRIGIEDSLPIDGLHTAPGSFDVSDAGENDLAWAGIGQYTDLVNPCQYMTWMGAIASGGTAAKPCLVAQAKCGGEVTYTASVSETGRMLDEAAAETLQEMMRYNVEKIYGTSQFPDVRVCAKSGTAEVGKDANTATFAGFVLDERYPLAFVVVVEGGGAGSETCAPIAGTVLRACINAMDGD